MVPKVSFLKMCFQIMAKYQTISAQRIILFCVLFYASFSVLFAQEKFDHLTIKDGLSNNSISNIIQSEDGFLWFGTLNGLNRYDGKEIRSYTYDPGNKYSLSSNRINYLYEDSLNYIWIITYEFQVLRFDPQTERFININLEIPAGKFRGRTGVKLYSSSPSIVWIVSEDGGIIRVTQQKGKDNFKFDFFSTGDITGASNKTFIYKGSDHRIWIGTHKGLMMLENDSVDISKLTRGNKHIIDTNYHFICCHEIENGYLVFGTANHGLFEYNDNVLRQWHILSDSSIRISDIEAGKSGDFIITTRGKGFYHVSQDFRIRNYHLNEINNFFDTYCDHTGTYWLLTSKRGISMFNAETSFLKHFDLHSDVRESLGDPDKQKLFEDKNGNIWIGIYGGGLCRYNRASNDFKYYYHEKHNSQSLSSNFILTLFEDKSENLWIGTFKKGLNKLDLSSKNFHYMELVENAKYESQNEVRCIAEDDKERIWIGTKFGDIYCCDKNNNILFRIPEDLKNANDYIRSNIYAILVDESDLWVGTKGNGLYHIKGVLDFDKKEIHKFEFKTYRHKSGCKTDLPSNDIFSLLKDQFGQIWIGTYHGGLSVIKNPNKEIKFTNYFSNPSDSTSISDNRIRKIYRDRNNNLWVGTVNGLNYLDSRYLLTDRKEFRWYCKDPTNVNSLTNNDVFDIHQDINGTIWVATYGGGLNSITTKNGIVHFNHFFRRDGLPSDIVFSILEDNHLNLWLGTDNGLVKFSIEKNSFELIDEEDGNGHGVFSEGCKYNSHNGEFLFGALNGYIRFIPDSINNIRNSYPLRFTGLTLFNETVLPGEEKSPLKKSLDKTSKIRLKYNQNFIGINFAVMDFRASDKIQYAYILENFEEKWNKTVNGGNAFYKGIPPGEYTFKLKATDSRGIWMDEIRELSIEIVPPFWKNMWAYFIYLIILIIILYSIISELKTRHEISYENKLLEEKFKFFTDVSHEFKTPLTLINNSIDDILKAKTYTKEGLSSINIIRKNALSLNVLIEQIIDLRRLQNGKLELKTQKIDIVSYAYDIYLTFLPYAKKKKLKFCFNTSIERYSGWIDVRYFDKIINNLLSNAFKHTSSNKRVLLDVSIDEVSEIITIKVQDQGEGISRENLDKIFDRFVFVNNSVYSNMGSGIGLSLASELVQLHKGTIKVDSKLGEGSTFSVEIPVGEKNYCEDEKTHEKKSFVVHQPNVLSYENTEEHSEKNLIPQHIKSANAVRLKLLIIDDNDELRDYLFDRLKKHFTVFMADNGKEGIKIAKDIYPDIIVTDLKMPYLDGISLTKQLKSNFETSHIPIILLTATSAMESKIKGLESGADDYITKPFSVEYLKKRIENIVQQRKQLKEKFSKDPGFKPERLSSEEIEQKFLSQVIESIERSMNKPDYNIDNMISEMGCSRTVFFKKMKAVSGYAPKEFVRMVKMKKAAELLMSPDISVAEVGFEIGFTDPSYFSKSFKNYFGETPTSYQRKYT